MLFETGHPWITFKDPCNLRSPQQPCRRRAFLEPLHRDHAQHLGRRGRGLQSRLGQPRSTTSRERRLDHARLQRTVTTAMRMLDNVIDINFYTIPEARRSNLRHRPVGLGLMGFQDALQALRHRRMASDAAVAFADASMEAICLPRHLGLGRSRRRARALSVVRRLAVVARASCRSIRIELARGCARRTRHGPLARRSTGTRCAQRVKTIGMRNSNMMAIAPTATISNICGVAQSIEPAYQNLYVKSNMSGDFTVVNAVPGARPQGARAVGRGDGHRPQIFRRQRRRRSTASRTTSRRSTRPPSRSTAPG